MIRFGSVCSGIEAASCAWHPLGWEAAFLSEIEPFPSAVLAHHYPDVPNLGDMTKFKEWKHYDINVLVGGTPCQSFSVAGLRKGLADPRGNLMLTYLAIADKYRPEWLVWENVPGVLSSNSGKDFGTFLGGLAELGYGFAYRILDAQYFGVPQRRRRVFVVGCLGDWRRAAAVLFERHSLQGHPAPRREAGQDVAGTFTAGAFSGGAGGRPEGAASGHFQPVICMAHGQGGAEIASERRTTLTCNHEAPIAAYGIPGNWIGRKPENGGNAVSPMVNVAPCLTGADRHGVAYSVALRGRDGGATAELGGEVAGTLRASGGGGDKAHVLAPIAFDTTQITSRQNGSNPQPGDACHPLSASGHAPAIAFDSRQDCVSSDQVFGALGSSSPQAQAVCIAGDITHALKAEGFDASEDGTGRGQPIVAAVQICPTLRAGGNRTGGDRPPGTDVDTADSLLTNGMAVRRLTAVECERLQGFPDGYTLIPFGARKKIEAEILLYLRLTRPELSMDQARQLSADGPRYKALGNSMAVPVMRWIGSRIQLVSDQVVMGVSA